MMVSNINYKNGSTTYGEGERKGRKEGALITLFGLVKDGVLSIADAAMRIGMSAADFERAYKTFML